MYDREWTLSYPGTSLTFGPPNLPIVNLLAPDLGSAELHTDDTDRPRSDGLAFGQDFRGGRLIGFELGVFGDNETEARETLDDLASAWRGDTVRTTPGAMAQLQTRNVGRERVMFGRPRRFALLEEDIHQGVVLVSADFTAADDLFYEAEEQSETIFLVPQASGGLITPLISPLTTTAESNRSRLVRVGGQVPTYPVFTIQGPITNPAIEVVNEWSMTFLTSLASDQALIVDTRPWARTARVGNGSRAGTLTHTSRRIATATLSPGDHEVALRGIDATGTASLQVTWRDAFTSL